MAEELYYDHFRREQRRRDLVELESAARAAQLEKECTFKPQLSRKTDEPSHGGTASARLYEDSQRKSVKIQKLVERLQKKHLMQQPTFKPATSYPRQEDDEFDLEKMTERLFQTAKEMDQRKERSRDKFYKVVCPFQPNMARRGKTAETTIDPAIVVTRLYEEEVVRRKNLQELNEKKVRKSEGLTFHPNTKMGKKPKKLNVEDSEKMVERLWQEAKERAARQDWLKSKEEKRLYKNIGKRPATGPPKAFKQSEDPLDVFEQGERLHQEAADWAAERLKKQKANLKAVLRDCNNFSPKLEKKDVAHEMDLNRKLPQKRFGRNPFSPTIVRERSRSADPYVHPLEPSLSFQSPLSARGGRPSEIWSPARPASP